ncbi:hypothetical protein LTR62_000683 [Meristemomyces frigidus]|uniref:Uncharacterized protein n=1 Tax=Meristemomyces frigidus TaxID=1508187 RepID=A0AAN7T9Y5_9PEZI|nr:hypothetical protein LTR62_000683 [Meristemomyces frigidus]
MLYTKTPREQGHWQQCWAATTAKSGLRNRGYYEPVGSLVKRAKLKTRQAKDGELAERLWECTEAVLERFEAGK